VTFDLSESSISVALNDAEIEARIADWTPPAKDVPSGVLNKYARLVSSADHGAVTTGDL